MIKVDKPIQVMRFLSGVIVLICGISAVMFPEIYHGFVEEKYIYGTIAQDVMAIMSSAILLLITIFIKKSSYIADTLAMGIMSFHFYAYGVYVIEQIYNVFYFGYMAVFSLSLYGILYSLFRLNWDMVSKVSISNGFRRLSASFTLLVPAIFVPLWVIMQAGLIVSGKRIENTYGVFIMDLCLIMPVFVIIAIFSFRKINLGIALSPSLFVLGFTLLFPVGFSDIVKWFLHDGQIGINLPSVVLYIGFAFTFLFIGIIQMKKLREKFYLKAGVQIG